MSEQSVQLGAGYYNPSISLALPTRLLVHLLTAAAYYGAGMLAFAVFPIGNGVAGIWPAAGLSVATMLLFGPSVSLAIFFSDFLVGLNTGLPTGHALLLATGAVGEALVAWYLLTRIARFDPRLRRIKDVTAFVIAGVLPATMLCMIPRMLLTAVMDGAGPTPAPNAQTVLVGLLGHGLGVLLVAPVILSWTAERPLLKPSAEFYLLLLAAVLLNAAAFTATPSGPASALLYAVFVVVLWAALRFGPRETSDVMLLTAIFATWAAWRASGPFIISNQIEALYSLSLFLMVATVTALLLAAAARERSASAQRVEESELAHRMLIEQMREGVITLDGMRRLAFVSDRFCALSGWQRQDLIGRPFTQLVATADRLRLEQALSDTERGQDVQIEVALERAGEGTMLASVAPRRLAGSEGQPARIMAVVADITESRRAAELSRLRLQQIAHTNRVQSMDEMAIAFAHEISQPLTAITSYAQAARRFLSAGSGAIGPAREAIDGAEREARRGSEIVRRIRGFVQDRKSERVPQVADLLVSEVAQLAEPEVRQHGVELRTDLCANGCKVLVDPVQIQQVLLNLVRNAAEAIGEAGSATRLITLKSVSAPPDGVAFAVIDSGPGFAPAELAKIFDPFYTSKPDGIGIGLALCRSIIEDHDGQLHGAAEPGRGATFTFTLKEFRDA
ncbi:MASE1 domain-containing protein [Propionivibrio sp.]|uniref:MASE1 domain-containing protein n=1 Tax=Propionivibrio sp. TaxID=2212460 RepID=UPI0025DE3313|nr:MASE1 domain-containing protein [Propionivibrio sp.]MBK7355949.1 MASE1 domain-containing protein [Propionivibrio sp.]